MNIVEYEIVMRVRRRTPIDLAPPPEVVTTDADGVQRVEVSELDMAREDHADFHARLVEHFTKILERGDNEHNEIADGLVLHGRRIAASGKARVWIDHVAGMTAPVEVLP
jgi:hypothetical protein